jgi:hypothetical protein
MIFNAKLHGKYFLEIFQKDMEGGIETANKFSLIFPIEKRRESGLINFSHPPTLLQTNTTCTIGFIDGIHKEEVETPSAFEFFLVRIIRVSVDFTPANITPTTNQVFSNPSTLTHTTHSNYTAESEFNCLDDKFYYDSNTDWIFDFRVTKHICRNHGAFTNFRTINETIQSSSREDAMISSVEDITINIQIGNEETLCILRDVWYSPTIPVNLLSVRCIEAHGNYVTIKDGYQIVNRKSGEVVIEGVSIEKMYIFKQSIPNFLYKNITEDIEQEKAFMAKVSLQTWHKRLEHINTR